VGRFQSALWIDFDALDMSIFPSNLRKENAIGKVVRCQGVLSLLFAIKKTPMAGEHP